MADLRSHPEQDQEHEVCSLSNIRMTASLSDLSSFGTFTFVGQLCLSLTHIL